MRALLEGRQSSDGERIAGSVSDTTMLSIKKQHRPPHGVNVNVRDNGGQTALMYAAKWRRADVVRLLLEHNADVYACDEDGNNALHLAVSGGYYHELDNPSHLLETLVDSGLYANTSNFAGDTCLHQVNIWKNIYKPSSCGFQSSLQQIVEWLL